MIKTIIIPKKSCSYLQVIGALFLYCILYFVELISVVADNIHIY